MIGSDQDLSEGRYWEPSMPLTESKRLFVRKVQAQICVAQGYSHFVRSPSSGASTRATRSGESFSAGLLPPRVRQIETNAYWLNINKRLFFTDIYILYHNVYICVQQSDLCKLKRPRSWLTRPQAAVRS